MHLDHGDYSSLARDYASFRPGYAPEIPARLLGLCAPAAPTEVDFVDVGAGTGIWTRSVAEHGCPTIAVEPNAAMRSMGARATKGLGIDWREGSAEATGLADASCDLLTMASSFHWTQFERAAAELARVLRPGGVFAALWNTRLLEESPLLLEIEEELRRRVPDLERVSSGRSEFCERLAERLEERPEYGDVQYLEGRHVEPMTVDRYLGVWRSVNDVRVQAGERVFAEFLRWIAERTRGLDTIEAAYRTRVWVARTVA